MVHVFLHARTWRTPRGVVLFLAILVGLAFAGSPARAQLCQGQFTEMNFGRIDATTGLAVDTTGAFQVQCQGVPNQTARVCANLGSGSGGDAGSGAQRTMRAGPNSLAYALYKDAARTQIWGSYFWSYSGSFPAAQFDIPLGPTGQSTRAFPVYGRVFANQASVRVGQYDSNFVGINVVIASGYTVAGDCAVISAIGGRQPNFAVKAEITAACNVTTTAIDFGARGSLASTIDASGQLRVVCTNGTPYSIGLSGGLSNAQSPTLRKMTKGTDGITYGLYGDAARTLPWFNTNNFYRATGTGNGNAQNYTVFGRVPAQTTPPSGVYTDTVAVVVTY